MTQTLGGLEALAKGDLRDWFAAHVLNGILASFAALELPPMDRAAREAYGYADAMLKARGETADVAVEDSGKAAP